MKFFLLDQTQVAAAINTPLPNRYSVDPIELQRGTYAGGFILPLRLLDDAEYAGLWPLLATLPQIDIPPSDTWVPEE